MAAHLKLRSTTEPLRLEYDATHYVPFVVESDGEVLVTPTGTAGATQAWKWGQHNGIVQQFPTGETDRAFNITLKNFTNPDSGASGRDDWVLRWGYNIAAGGGRANSADHSIAYEIENYWYQAGSGYWTEIHLAYTSKNDGVTRRLYSWLVDVDDDTATMYMQSGTYDFRDMDGAGTTIFSATTDHFDVTTPIRRTGEDVVLLLSGAAGDSAMVACNSAGEPQIGSATVATRIPTILKVGQDDQGSAANVQIKVYGGGGDTFKDLLVLESVSNGPGTYAGMKFKIATSQFGRIGYDGEGWDISTNSGTGSDTKRMRWYQDITLYTAGKGLVVTTPDGAHTYRLAVDNAGAVTSTMLT